MDFSTKNRKQLQRLCKKHGIPANLKNIEMVERLKLIFKEKENPVPRRLQTYKDKSDVEIIKLDSDSDTDVQMEAQDIVSVAEKDSNEMNNVNVERVLDEVHSSGLKDSVEEPDQLLATSSLSKVKSSDLSIHRNVDSDIVSVAEKDSTEMNNVNVEHCLDELHSSGLKHSVEEPDQFLATSSLSKVKSSDLNIHCTVDSDTIAEKDSNEKTNVDELHSSGLKYSVGEQDQFLVTSPLSEVKSSDLNIHHTVDSGTADGNADVSEVNSASSQQQGQDVSHMTLEGEKSEDNVRSVHLEENKEMTVIKDKIEDNEEFYQPTPTDLNVHQMVDSGTADGHVDACEVISESLQTTSQAREESKMKLTPERSVSVGTFYAEENIQMSVNVLEQFGNYMMMGEDLYGTLVQFLPTVDLNIDKMIVRDTCEEGMLRLSEKTCMIADPKECIGFSLNELEASITKGSEPETSFDETTVGGVMETCNRKESMQVTTKGSEAETYSEAEIYNRNESMQVDMTEKENNKEDCTSDQGEVNKFFDNSDVVEKDCKEKTDVTAEHFLDEVHSSGLNYSVGKPDNFQATSLLSETKFSDSDTVAEKDSNEETNVDEVHSSGLKYLFGEPDQCLTTSPLSEVKSSDLNIHHMVDSGAVAGNADACEVRSASLQQMSEFQEESEMKLQCERSENSAGSFYSEENTQMSVNKEHIEGELSPATPTDLDVLHMVDSGTSAGDADGCEVKPASLQCREEAKNKLTPQSIDQELHQTAPTVSQPSETVSCNFSLQQVFALDIEACIGFPPNNLEAAATKGSEADNDDFGAEELVQTVPQPSEMESFNSSLQQLFASEPDQCLTTSPLSEVKSRDLNIHHMVDSDTCEEEMMKLSEKSCMFDDNSDVCDNIGGVGAQFENQPPMTSRKRKSRDEDNTCANSDEDLKADELVPTVPQPSEMESYTFSLQQLFASDAASGDEDACENKLDLTSKAIPIASCEKNMIFSPKLVMSLPQKRERDSSIGTCDMKENINIDKMEEVGSIMSKTKFAKRQPLQDLQQN